MNKLWAIAAVLALGACNVSVNGSGTAVADTKAIAETAHKAYVDAINSNDINKVAAVLTDDVVFQAPNAPEIVGKQAVLAWGKGYFQAYKSVWKKTSLEFVVNGDWAYERYAYEVTDTDKATGAATSDKGKGINIYRKGGDGVWRIARDGWSSDLPPASSDG